jgi:hypothetical protein
MLAGLALVATVLTLQQQLCLTHAAATPVWLNGTHVCQRPSHLLCCVLLMMLAAAGRLRVVAALYGRYQYSVA